MPPCFLMAPLRMPCPPAGALRSRMAAWKLPCSPVVCRWRPYGKGGPADPSRRLLAQPARLAAGVLVLVGPRAHNGATGWWWRGKLHLAGGRVRICALRATETPARRTQASCPAGWDPRPDGSADPVDAALWIDGPVRHRPTRVPAEDLQQLFRRAPGRPSRPAWWPIDVAHSVPSARWGPGFLGAWRPCASQTFVWDWLKQGLVAGSVPGLVGQLEAMRSGPARRPAGEPCSRISRWAPGRCRLKTAPQRPVLPPEGPRNRPGPAGWWSAGSDRYRGCGFAQPFGCPAPSGCGSPSGCAAAASAAGLWGGAAPGGEWRLPAGGKNPPGAWPWLPLAVPGVLDRLDACFCSGPGNRPLDRGSAAGRACA